MNELNNKQKVIFAVEAVLFLGARLILCLSLFFQSNAGGSSDYERNLLCNINVYGSKRI